MNIVLGARNGSVSCCSSSAARASDSVDGASAATIPLRVVSVSQRRAAAAGVLATARLELPRHAQFVVVGIGSQRALHQPLGRDAVDQRVVHLDVQRVAAVVEPFDEMRFPQRAVPVEQGAVQPRRQLQQIANSPGLGSAERRRW